MLFRDFKTVVYRGGLPHPRCNMFERLRFTLRRCSNILEQIAPLLEIVPIEGKQQLMRARDRRPVNRKHCAPALFADTE
jgi:hypothetical protein